jgi:hypothetical protein
METLWAKWFDGRVSIAILPAECIEDCSASGSVDSAVDYWVERLNFEAPPWLLRHYLRGYGVWDSAELCDHQANLRRLLWVWAGDCSEDEGCDYCYLSG